MPSYTDSISGKDSPQLGSGGASHVKAIVSASGNLSVSTNSAAGTGINPVLVPAQACLSATLSAPVGIEVRQDGVGAYFQIPANTPFTFRGLSNASQLGVRRTDVSDVAAIVSIRWEN